MFAFRKWTPRWKWPAVYIAVITLPVAALLFGASPPGGGFWWDLALALGYMVLAMTAAQFALTARFKRAAAPFGVDLVYCFHHYVGVVILLLLAAHVSLLLEQYPEALGRTPAGALQTHIVAGWVGLFALLVLTVSSIWRKRLRIDYDFWRRAHVVLALVALLAAALHVHTSGSYLRAPLKRGLWISLVAFGLGLSVYVRLVRPARLMRRPWRVLSVHPERGRSWTLALEPCDGRPFAYRAGQFAWVTLRASPFAMCEHPFSISSAPTRDENLQITVKALGDFTAQIGDIAPGEVAYIDGPYGAFTVEQVGETTGLVFITGGAGIAPVISMLRTLADRGDPRPLWLFYGNGRWSDVVFREELAELAARLQLKLVHVLSNPPRGWRGEWGLIDSELLARHLPEQRKVLQYLVCGPAPMMKTVEHSLRALGVPAGRLHTELFDLA